MPGKFTCDYYEPSLNISQIDVALMSKLINPTSLTSTTKYLLIILVNKMCDTLGRVVQGFQCHVVIDEIPKHETINLITFL